MTRGASCRSWRGSYCCSKTITYCFETIRKSLHNVKILYATKPRPQILCLKNSSLYQTTALWHCHTFPGNAAPLSPRDLKGTKAKKTSYKTYININIRKHVYISLFLLSKKVWGIYSNSSLRNIPSGEERWETDVFAGYSNSDLWFKCWVNFI